MEPEPLTFSFAPCARPGQNTEHSPLTSATVELNFTYWRLAFSAGSICLHNSILLFAPAQFCEAERTE